MWGIKMVELPTTKDRFFGKLDTDVQDFFKQEISGIYENSNMSALSDISLDFHALWNAYCEHCEMQSIVPVILNSEEFLNFGKSDTCENDCEYVADFLNNLSKRDKREMLNFVNKDELNFSTMCKLIEPGESDISEALDDEILEVDSLISVIFSAYDFGDVREYLKIWIPEHLADTRDTLQRVIDGDLDLFGVSSRE